MEQVNFLQRVGHVSCIRCDFETSDRMSFEEQNAAMNAHLTEKHPDWMTDGGASIRKDRLPKPAPTEAEVARMRGEIDALKAELAEAEDWNKTSKEHQEHWLGRFVEAQRRRIDALKLELAEARKPLTDMKERVNAVLRIYLQGVSRHDATEDIVNLLASRTAPVEPDPRYGRIAADAILEHPVGFYEEIERRLHAERIARVTTDRPANLHDYQGCVEQPAPNLDGAIWPDGLPNPTQKPVDQPEAAQEDAVARIAKTLHALVGKDPFATYREMAEAIIPVAREGYYSAEQVEKAVQDEINYCQLAHKMPRAFVDDVLFRLAHPKGEQHG